MKAQDLKNSILQLAIQGKLVPQDANDEAAEVLYAKIQAEKQKLIKEGKIKKDKPLPPITADEISFDIPPSWKWVRIGNVGYTQTGTTPSKNHPEYYGNEYPFVKPADIDENGQVNIPDEYLSSLGIKQGRFIPKESILMICIGSVGRAGIVKFDCSCNQQINALTPFLLDSKYILYAMCSKSFQTQALVNTSQTTLPILNKGKWDNLLIPLPPLAEQKRIVAKIEEFEPLVKQYDKAETELSTLNDSFPEQLKKSILQYAIQGKLVEQDTNDEPAEVLYAKIQAEKQKQIKEGKIKKDKPLPPITDDEIPFAIPSTWKWVRLGDIIFKLTDGTHSTPKYTNQGVPFISVKDLSSGYINFSNTKFISEEEHKILSARCNPEKGDLLLTKVGTTGIPVIVDTDREFSLFVSVALVKLSKSNINLDFLKLLILSPLVQEQVAENTKGIGNKNWVIKDIANTFFPLPPLAEQHRIVAKVNELMQYCEKLQEWHNKVGKRDV